MLLQFVAQSTNHAEIEDADASVGHDTHVARVRICMEKTIFQQLFEIEIGTDFSQLSSVEALFFQCFNIGDPCAGDELDSEHSSAGKTPDNTRNINVWKIAEIVSEAVGISSFADIVDLFKCCAGKLFIDCRPVSVAA